jgi:hypothetical protein
MILTPNQRRSLERALALVNGTEEALTYMEKVAAAAPVFQGRVQPLRERQQYIQQLATVAITADTTSQ